MKTYGSLSELSAMVDWEKVAREVIQKRNAQEAQEKGNSIEEADVKQLYKVYVIDPETDEILVDGKSVIAKSEETSKFHVLRDLGRDPDELVVKSTVLFSFSKPNGKD
ncbi:MAG TPA: hypothetical protein VM163_02720 [bacterium]|nr:hypothetical protein [bacterium]